MFSNVYEEEKTYENGREFEDDKKLLVRFETRAVKNDFESTKAGRPIFYDAEYISIITPGSRDVHVAPLDDHYKLRFRDRYDKWRSTQADESHVGTPLSELTWMTKSQVAELNYANVFTVEQLANLTDANAMKFMGNNQMRERAKKFIEAAEGQAPMLKMEADLALRDSQIQTMQETIKALQEQMAKLQKK